MAVPLSQPANNTEDIFPLFDMEMEEDNINNNHQSSQQILRNTPPRGGYDVDLFVNSNQMSEYVCQICHEVSRDCVEVSCGNGHIFCNDCICYHFQINGHSCPADRAKNIDITHNDFVRRKIFASDVKCQYHSNNNDSEPHTGGCQWIGALRQFDTHIETCKYKPMECKYCKKQIAQTMINEHYKHCMEYLVRCAFCCNQYKRKMLSDHELNCYCKPISCSNDECTQQISSNQLQYHLENECSERLIECNMIEYGCKEKIKFKNIEMHNNQNKYQHLDLKINYILKENHKKDYQINALRCHICQLQAPQMLLVTGCSIQAMNGIYKKCLNKIDNLLFGTSVRTSQCSSPVLSGNVVSVNDEKKMEDIMNDNDDSKDGKSIDPRPFYVKCDDSNWVLHYHKKTQEWIFDSKGFQNDAIGDGCCNDDALNPVNIENDWKIWIGKDSKYIEEKSLKIMQIDVFTQILQKMQYPQIIKLINNSNKPHQNTKHNNAVESENGNNNNNGNVQYFAANDRDLFDVDEEKAAVLDPRIAMMTDYEEKSEHTNQRKLSIASDVSSDQELQSETSTVGSRSRSQSQSQSQSVNANGIKQSRVSMHMHGAALEMPLASLEPTLDRNNNSANSNNNNEQNACDWGVLVQIKNKYDQLYNDLLEREKDSSSDSINVHHNPFGPPMVSNASLYRYLTNVGYSDFLIKSLWKLISNNSSNLMTRNGFVAICHMSDKITNYGDIYKIPNSLPSSLQSNVLDNLISTPIHHAHLNSNNSTVFPKVRLELENDDDSNDNVLMMDDNAVDLFFNNANQHNINAGDILDLSFETGKQPITENLLDFGMCTRPSADNIDVNMDHDLRLLNSSTQSTPIKAHGGGNGNGLSPNMSPLLNFMNASSGSKTKPNTPRGGIKPMNQSNMSYLQPHAFMKSKSAEFDEHVPSMAARSHPNLFQSFKNKKSSSHSPQNSFSQFATMNRNIVNNNHHNNINNMNKNRNKNDLDDLWSQQFHSSLK